MATLFRRMEARTRRLNVMTEDEPRVLDDDQIEAAHCCTSIGADQDEADSRAMPGCGPVLWLVYCVLALLAVAAGWHFVADWLQGAPL